MRFIVDAQLPESVVSWLNRQRFAATHVDDLGLAGATDDELWQRAIRDNAVLVTRVQGFVQRRLREPGPRVVWVGVADIRGWGIVDKLSQALPQLTETPRADIVELVD